jgi:GTP 3',8-cyclase
MLEQSLEESKDGIGHLRPHNWVYHPEIVDKVLQGDYNGIMPYSAEFVTTMNCTNRCKIPCGYKLQKIMEECWDKNDFSNPTLHMKDRSVAIPLAEKLINGGIKGVIFTGGGEPFLFKDLEYMVKYFTERKVDVTVYTNGNCSSRRRIESLVEASPLLVRVSLNTGDPKNYAEFHQSRDPKAYFNVLNTIENLAKGSLRNPEMSVGVSVAINEINAPFVVDTAQRVREISERVGGGIEFMSYRPAFNYHGRNQLNIDFLERTHEIVEEDVKEVLSNTGIKLSNVSCRYDALKNNTRNYSQCRANGLYVEMGPSGKLHLCCERNCNRNFVIGDLKTQTVKEIWEGELRKAMIDYINASACYACFPGCKPHETNIQFQFIEDMREQGRIKEIQSWIKEVQRQSPKMKNF